MHLLLTEKRNLQRNYITKLDSNGAIELREAIFHYLSKNRRIIRMCLCEEDGLPYLVLGYGSLHKTHGDVIERVICERVDSKYLVIPEESREILDLEKSVRIMYALDYIEIWNPNHYEQLEPPRREVVIVRRGKYREVFEDNPSNN